MSRNRVIALIIVIILCVIIAAIFGYLLFKLYKQKAKAIDGGIDDEYCKKVYQEEHSKKAKRIAIASNIVSAVVGLLFTGMFAISLYVNVFNNNKVISGTSIPHVVMSGSMSKKNANNKYLFENDLNNQFETYDLIFLDKLPDQFELKQYDIVMYEVEDTLIIHRIINIEEPNEKHPNERYFQLKGDTNASPDRFPVKYEQMKGIYNNNKIMAVGMFIAFFQSPLGYLTIIIIIAYIVVTPMVEKKFACLINNRLMKIEYLKEDGTINENYKEDKAVDVISDDLVEKEKKSWLSFLKKKKKK